jgi:hypothetical protein
MRLYNTTAGLLAVLVIFAVAVFNPKRNTARNIKTGHCFTTDYKNMWKVYDLYDNKHFLGWQIHVDSAETVWDPAKIHKIPDEKIIHISCPTLNCEKYPETCESMPMDYLPDELYKP